MGQKVHPFGLRLGINKTWQSRWYTKKNYKDLLLEDEKIRKHIRKKLSERRVDAGLARTEIERAANRVTVILHTAKPGVVIGQRGRGVEELQNSIKALVNREVRINVQEVHQPDLNGQLVAENVAQQIVRRIAFRRAMRQTITRCLRSGAQGIKIICSGRLGGAEIARHESVKEGKVPLHTLRADIDYGMTEAVTTYGNIGVRVWIYRGDILPKVKETVKTLRAPVITRGQEEAVPDVDAG